MSTAPGWPAVLATGPVGLRPLRMRDAAAWVESRLRNEAWLAPWEGAAEHQVGLSWGERHTLASFATLLRLLRRDARAGRAMPFLLTHEGQLAGQLTVSNVVRGAFASATVGYWVDGELAGRGIMPTALALVVDHCFGPAGLHRVEADIRPENTASRRVVEKLGFREEGLHRRFLFIDGDWRDHVSYAVLREEVPEGMLRRWQHRSGTLGTSA